MNKRDFSFAGMIRASCAVLLLATGNAAFAEDNAISLVIAPPPVGYPAIEAGAKTAQIGVSGLYASYEANGFELTFIGASALIDAQQCPSDRIAINGSAGLSMLAGDKYDMFFMQVPFNGDIIFKLAGSRAFSLFAFGGATGNLGVMAMTMTIPQLSGFTLVYDDTTLTTVMLTATALGGLQANIPVSSFIISPFGFCTITGGTYTTTMTSSMSYTYPSTSGSIDPTTGFVLGFDALYVPLNFALSSQFHRDADFTLITVASKWKIGK